VLFSLISGLVLPVMSVLIGRIFATFATVSIDESSSLPSMRKNIFLLIFGGFGSFISNAAFCAAWMWNGEDSAQRAQRKVFENLICCDLEWIEQMPKLRSGVRRPDYLYFRVLESAGGNGTKEITFDIVRPRLQYRSQPLGYATQSGVTAVVSLCVALYHSWKQTLVALCCVPIAIIAPGSWVSGCNRI
jgi:ATP-binding cassette subfamily B (MDR/TAP) protein 1